MIGTQPANNLAVPKFELLTPEDIAALPDLEWLIEGVLPMPGLVVLYGEPGSGKTFVALSMALTTASGQTWLGRATRQTKALYIACRVGHDRVSKDVALPVVCGQLRVRDGAGKRDAVPHT